MRLLNPSLILLTLPIFIAIGWTLRKRSARDLRSIIAAMFRALTCTAVVIALAGPFRQHERPADTLIALLDVSASISQRQGEELLSKAHGLARALGVPLSIVPFAKNVGTAAIPSQSSDSYSAIRQSWEKLDSGGSNLEKALLFPETQSVALLLSDGYETVGKATNATGLSRRALFPLTAPGESSDEEISVSQLRAPLTVKAQKSVDIRATVTNRRATPQNGTLELSHGDKVIMTRAVTIPAQQDLSVIAQSDPALEGLHTIQATFSWRDSSGEHASTRAIWLSGEKRDRVLVLSGLAEDERYLAQILKSQSYQLQTLQAGASFDSNIHSSDFRAIILNNISYSDLPNSLRTSLGSYVRGGGGLVMIGGNRSFGLGGYIGSAIEELLPVRLVQPHQEKKRLNLAVQLVIDKSRSMSTDNRLEFAKAAAEEVVRSLKDDDYLGVIGFDDVPFIALPISQVRSVRDSALTRISRLFPTSRTNLYPALDEARRGLARVNAGRKHAIVLTDGKLPDPGPYYFELIKQMRLLGITVSTVMVGSDADDGFLARMAESGGGAFYQTTDPSNLPKVFLSDIKVASGEKTLKEEPDLPVRAGPDPRVSTDIASFPPLRGFVETLQRDSAKTELVITDTEGTYPLLASWSVGQGRVLAFTSDANGRWSAPWMRWERIQEFWSDLIESSRKKRAAKEIDIPFELRSWVEGDEAIIDLSLFEEFGGGEVKAKIVSPTGDATTVSFSEIKRGHFQARLPQATAGTYRATLVLGEATLPEVAWNLSGELFGERSYRKPNLSLLSELASASGGKLDPSSEDLKPLLKQTSDMEPLGRLFLMFALVTMLAEIALRALKPKRARYSYTTATTDQRRAA